MWAPHTYHLFSSKKRFGRGCERERWFNQVSWLLFWTQATRFITSNCIGCCSRNGCEFFFKKTSQKPPQSSDLNCDWILKTSHRTNEVTKENAKPKKNASKKNSTEKAVGKRWQMCQPNMFSIWYNGVEKMRILVFRYWILSSHFHKKMHP